jgi:hypothetical protein
MKAELEDIGGGMFLHVTYKDGELEKKVKLAFSLVPGDQFELKCTREALEDLTDLLNRMDKNETH